MALQVFLCFSEGLSKFSRFRSYRVLGFRLEGLQSLGS